MARPTKGPNEFRPASKRRRGIVSPGPCADCGEPGEFYMVHNRLWAAAGMNPHGGFLCIECLEDRLGRSLCCDDFTDAPLNDLTVGFNQVLIECGRFSPRLIDRLTTPGPPPSPGRARVSRKLAHHGEGEGEVAEQKEAVVTCSSITTAKERGVGAPRSRTRS
jgi:hypothetical protein